MKKRPHSDYTPDPRNANRETPRGRKALEHSLRSYGAGRSILVDRNGVVIAGNKTLQEAVALGIPVVEVETDGRSLVAVRRSDLDLDTDKAARELAYADNISGALGFDLDPDIVREDLDAGIDLAGLGFGPELDALIAGLLPEAGAGGDEFDATPDDGPTRAQPGDLWVIGGVHRLIVGDSTDPATVARLMQGERVDAVVTDPPYGVDKDEWDASFPPLTFWRLISGYLIEGGSLIVFPGVADLPPKLSILASVYTYQWPIVWYKPNAMQFGKTGFSVLDIAWWFTNGAMGYRPQRRDVIVDAIVPSQNDFGHASPKQVGVMLELMDFVPADGLSFDPFLGSGTTLIAAHRTGRRCYGVELSPRYADVILRRAEAEGLTCERAE